MTAVKGAASEIIAALSCSELLLARVGALRGQGQSSAFVPAQRALSEHVRQPPGKRELSKTPREMGKLTLSLMGHPLGAGSGPHGGLGVCLMLSTNPLHPLSTGLFLSNQDRNLEILP